MNATILKAPTGWGKTQFAIEKAKEMPIILAVPTVKLGREILERARNSGIAAVFVEGRRNLLCGKKVKSYLEERDNKKVLAEDVYKFCEDFSFRADSHPQLRQTHLCCEKGCPFDPFSYLMEISRTAQLTICTHALLKVNSFIPLFESGKVLVIDEVQTFIRSLRTPVLGFSSVSISEILSLLSEILNLKEAKKTVVKEALKRIKTAGEKIAEVTCKEVCWLYKGGKLKLLSPSMEQVNRHIEAVIQGLLSIRQNAFKKKTLVVTNALDEISRIVELLRRIKDPLFYAGILNDGSYATISSVDGNTVFGIHQTLFSNAMWSLWNGILKNISPKEVIFMSATLPSSLKGLLKPFKEVKRIEHSYRFKSTLDVIIGSKEYSYESREEFIEYFISLFERFKRDKKAVILASAFRDIEAVKEELERKGYIVLAQNRENGISELLDLFENGDYDILIGNRSLWEGLNLKVDSDFFVFKVPYPTPEEPEVKVEREYWQRNYFPIVKEDTKNLMIQGLGRVVRKDGEEKRVIIADRRVLSFDDLFTEIPAYKSFVDLSKFPDWQLEEETEIEIPPSEGIKEKYPLTYDCWIAKVISGKEKEVLEECLRKYFRKDREKGIIPSVKRLRGKFREEGSRDSLSLAISLKLPKPLVGVASMFGITDAGVRKLLR
ncbi:helicase C-terminal domain-containing protein [Desulfurobacterium crinifex]